jgi:hypothetical protein
VNQPTKKYDFFLLLTDTPANLFSDDSQENPPFLLTVSQCTKNKRSKYLQIVDSRKATTKTSIVCLFSQFAATKFLLELVVFREYSATFDDDDCLHLLVKLLPVASWYKETFRSKKSKEQGIKKNIAHRNAAGSLLRRARQKTCPRTALICRCTV